MAAIFDTLEYAKEAEQAGFTPKQAEFQARKMVILLDTSLATKNDVKLIREDLSNFKSEVSFKFKELEYKLTIKLGSLVIGCSSIIMIGIGVLGFLLKH